MKPVFLFFSILIFTLTACEKVVYINIKEADRRIVLNGLLCPDSSVVVDITRSFQISMADPFDTIIKPVEALMIVNDASFYENDRFIGKLKPLRANFYELPGFKPAPGKTYRLEVSSGEMKPVSTIVKVPELIPFNSFDTARITMINGTAAVRVSFQITDQAGQDNYYALQVTGTQQHYYDFWEQKFIDSVTTHIYTPKLNGKADDFLNLDFLDINRDVYLDHKLFFSDQLFNGKVFDISFEIPKRNRWEMADTVLFRVDLCQVDKSYYQFAVSAQKYNSSNGDPFSEPVQVYSNVKNGFGLFSAYNGIRKEFIVDWTR